MSNFALDKTICIIGSNKCIVNVFAKDYKVIESDKVSNIPPVDVYITTLYDSETINFIKEHAKDGDVLIVTGDVPIGTTSDFFFPIGIPQLHIGYCPLTSMNEVQVISGFTPEAIAEISEIYGRIYSSIISVSSTDTAEMFNITRLARKQVDCAFENEIINICNRYNIDSKEIFSTTTHPVYPSPNILELVLYNHIPMIANSLDLNQKRPLRKALNFLASYSNKRMLIVASSLSEDKAFIEEVNIICPDNYMIHTELTDDQLTSEYLSANFDVIAILDDSILLPDVTCKIVKI